MLSLFVKNCKNLSIPSPQPEIGGIPYCIALIYSVSILMASSSPLAFNSACSINLFSCSSQSTSSEYPFIISCPFTTNWNLSVNFGFSSLLLASGDKSIGCSIRYVGFIMFGLLTFLYNVSIKFPLPNCSKLSASSFIPFAFISASGFWVSAAGVAAQRLSRYKPAKKSSPNSKKSYRQKKSIAKQRRQNGTLGRLK